jgi:hypothetical protein
MELCSQTFPPLTSICYLLDKVAAKDWNWYSQRIGSSLQKMVVAVTPAY